MVAGIECKTARLMIVITFLQKMQILAEKDDRKWTW